MLHGIDANFLSSRRRHQVGLQQNLCLWCCLIILDRRYKWRLKNIIQNYFSSNFCFWLKIKNVFIPFWKWVVQFLPFDVHFFWLHSLACQCWSFHAVRSPFVSGHCYLTESWGTSKSVSDRDECNARKFGKANHPDKKDKHDRGQTKSQ